MPARPSLQRAKNPMPPAIRAALTDRDLMRAYRLRPPYQQNDYLGWIARGKLESTRTKRLEQMLDELARGDVYMKMKWSPSREVKVTVAKPRQLSARFTRESRTPASSTDTPRKKRTKKSPPKKPTAKRTPATKTPAKKKSAGKRRAKKPTR